MEGKQILLVEDDFLNRRLTRKALLEKKHIVFEAKNTQEALEIIRKEALDLIILDINLGENEQDGISLGQYLMNNIAIPFIYLTAYDTPNIMNKAIGTNPHAYLTKPFRNIDLWASINLALMHFSDKKKYKPTLLVRDGEYNLELPIEDINYIESEANYLLVHTSSKVYKCRSTISQMLEKLPESYFVQTHRAYIVNKNKVEKFNSNHVVVNGAIVPFSKTYIVSK